MRGPKAQTDDLLGPERPSDRGWETGVSVKAAEEEAPQGNKTRQSFLAFLCRSKQTNMVQIRMDTDPIAHRFC